MLDNILSSVRRGAGRVQRRGEEVAQTTRLRLEIFQLTRELDALYARLGRSYHGGADPGVLQGVQADIRRVDEEISARERLIHELSHDEPPPGSPEPTPGQASSTLVASPTPPAGTQLSGMQRPDFTSDPVSGEPSPPGTEPTIPDAMPRPHAEGGAAQRDGEPPPGGEPGR